MNQSLLDKADLERLNDLRDSLRYHGTDVQNMAVTSGELGLLMIATHLSACMLGLTNLLTEYRREELIPSDHGQGVAAQVPAGPELVPNG